MNLNKLHIQGEPTPELLYVNEQILLAGGLNKKQIKKAKNLVSELWSADLGFSKKNFKFKKDQFDYGFKSKIGLGGAVVCLFMATLASIVIMVAEVHDPISPWIALGFTCLAACSSIFTVFSMQRAKSLKRLNLGIVKAPLTPRYSSEDGSPNSSASWRNLRDLQIQHSDWKTEPEYIGSLRKTASLRNDMLTLAEAWDAADKNRVRFSELGEDLQNLEAKVVGELRQLWKEFQEFSENKRIQETKDTIGLSLERKLSVETLQLNSWSFDGRQDEEQFELANKESLR